MRTVTVLHELARARSPKTYSLQWQHEICQQPGLLLPRWVGLPLEAITNSSAYSQTHLTA